MSTRLRPWTARRHRHHKPRLKRRFRALHRLDSRLSCLHCRICRRGRRMRAWNLILKAVRAVIHARHGLSCQMNVQVAGYAIPRGRCEGSLDLFFVSGWLWLSCIQISACVLDSHFHYTHTCCILFYGCTAVKT
jgi:hypothetical protein